jgi:anti-sigma regulatory factor (Ser/Thr protein kinase)
VIKEAIWIPADINFLANVREFIQNIGREHRFSSRVTSSMMLAVEEACTNVIRHGYKNVQNGKILIEAIVRRMRLEIIIVDQGETYDPRLAVRPAITELAVRGKKGGLGILMIRKLMDEIDYRTEERGNEFHLIKYRDDLSKSHIFQFWHFVHDNRYLLVAAFINLFIIAVIVYLLFFLF